MDSTMAILNLFVFGLWLEGKNVFALVFLGVFTIMLRYGGKREGIGGKWELFFSVFPVFLGASVREWGEGEGDERGRGEIRTEKQAKQKQKRATTNDRFLD